MAAASCDAILLWFLSVASRNQCNSAESHNCSVQLNFLHEPQIIKFFEASQEFKNNNKQCLRPVLRSY